MRLHVLEVGGSPFKLGYSWGRQARTEIRAGVLFYKTHWQKLTGFSWNRAWAFMQPGLILLQRFLPATFQELQGVGQGSGVPWQELFMINSLEALKHKRERCTSILAKNNQQIFLAHNEDWIAQDQRWLYLLKAKPKAGPNFLVLTYGAWLQTYGLNSVGLAYAADSLASTDTHPRGIAATFIGRELMRCATIAQATRIIRKLPRAHGHAYALAHKNGQGLVIETTARKYALLNFSKKCHSSQYGIFSTLVHTNFYQAPTLQKYLVGARTYSRWRFCRVNELLRTIYLRKSSKQTSPTKLFAILSDHQNYPEAVCCHRAEVEQNPLEDQTLSSLVLDPEAGTLWVTAGNPCAHAPQKFSF